MTSEERFTKIENTLLHLSEIQVGQQAEIDKQNAGIRDLIVVARTIVDSQKASQEAQRRSDNRLDVLNEKLSSLIDTVDRFLKGMQKPNGSGKGT